MMRIFHTDLLAAFVFLGAACSAQQRPVESPLQIPNPHYVVVTESTVVNAPVDKVWARVGGFCAITEWMNSPEWEDCRYLQGAGGPGRDDPGRRPKADRSEPDDREQAVPEDR